MIPRSAALEHLLERDDERISEAGRTILLSHGAERPRAIVLFHGLTATPQQFRRYASDLFARGHNVLVPRLPRHGYRDRLTEALAGMTEEHLRELARESLVAARALGTRVTVGGFSAGGTLALWLAQHDEFDRAVAIAPFLGAAAVPAPLMAVGANVLLRLPNRFVWWDPIRRERQMPDDGYPRYATHALAQLYRLSSAVMRDASKIPAARAVIVVLNGGEVSVSNGAIRATLRRWRAAGARIERVDLRGMPPSHDIIEPDRNPRLAARVYPAILEAVDPVRDAA
ncbi:MAG TPA: alpha/beta fold hydrolase [Candidatus Dormibacteraeota bacterium]|nr:alpha/beta fold hydrolase [Candidatus Dormibacteraeota bacterium]